MSVLTIQNLKPNEILLTIGEYDICRLEGMATLFLCMNGTDFGKRFEDFEHLKEWANDHAVITLSYWDCECALDIIHHKSTRICPICKAPNKKSPYSQLTDVINFLKFK